MLVCPSCVSVSVVCLSVRRVSVCLSVCLYVCLSVVPWRRNDRQRRRRRFSFFLFLFVVFVVVTIDNNDRNTKKMLYVSLSSLSLQRCDDLDDAALLLLLATFVVVVVAAAVCVVVVVFSFLFFPTVVYVQSRTNPYTTVGIFFVFFLQ